MSALRSRRCGQCVALRPNWCPAGPCPGDARQALGRRWFPCTCPRRRAQAAAVIAGASMVRGARARSATTLPTMWRGAGARTSSQTCRAGGVRRTVGATVQGRDDASRAGSLSARTASMRRAEDLIPAICSSCGIAVRNPRETVAVLPRGADTRPELGRLCRRKTSGARSAAISRSGRWPRRRQRLTTDFHIDANMLQLPRTDAVAGIPWPRRLVQDVRCWLVEY